MNFRQISSISGLSCALAVTALALSPFLSGCSAMERAKPRQFNMGERAEAGPLIYTVLEAEWRSQLGQGVEARLPKNRFLLLRVSVTNSGTSEVFVPAMMAITSEDKSYPELADGEGVPEWMGTLRRLQPAETVFGRVLFDMPRGDCKLRVTDETLDPEQARVALIDIPLRFETKQASPVLPGDNF